MVSRVLPSSASAAVVAVDASEDLVKRTDEALNTPSRDANFFRDFCEWLKNCSINDILTVLPTILKGHESEKVGERLNAYELLDALSNNPEMQKALTHLLKKTNCTAYLNSAGMLKGLCSALDRADMGWDRFQILKGASEQQDLSLRAAACELLCRSVTPQTEDTLFMAAVICQDNENSKDLSVDYFEALFSDGYFQRKGVFSMDLNPVIQQAHRMSISGEPERMWAAHRFFQQFIAEATPEQFALLTDTTIAKKWKQHSAGEHEDIFRPLWEQYQKRASAAVSSS